MGIFIDNHSNVELESHPFGELLSKASYLLNIAFFS